MKKTFLSLIMIFLICGSVNAQEYVLERSYSTSYINTNKQCELDKYKAFCHGYMNFLVSRFENEQLQKFNASVDYNDLLSDFVLPHSTQKVFIDFIPITSINLITIVTHVSIKTEEGDDSYIETANLNATTGHLLGFKDLFENPELAAMICSRKVEAAFKKNASKMLPLVVAAVESNPVHFLMLPDGLEFVFPPNLVAKTTKDSTLKIDIEELLEAKPIMTWFPNANK